MYLEKKNRPVFRPSALPRLHSSTPTCEKSVQHRCPTPGAVLRTTKKTTHGKTSTPGVLGDPSEPPCRRLGRLQDAIDGGIGKVLSAALYYEEQRTLLGAKGLTTRNKDATSFLLLVEMHLATSSFLLLVEVPVVPSSFLLLLPRIPRFMVYEWSDLLWKKA